MYFTQHAVERFRERFAAGLSYAHALRELKVLATSARRLREKTDSGEYRYEVSDGSRMILVVKRDPKAGDVCVTVLFGDESAGIEGPA